jgi:hypothetical protein
MAKKDWYQPLFNCTCVVTDDQEKDNHDILIKKEILFVYMKVSLFYFIQPFLHQAFMKDMSIQKSQNAYWKTYEEKTHISHCLTVHV